jgi:hypothetical protein
MNIENKIPNTIPLKKDEEAKKFKLIISKNIEKQIRRLCSKFPTKEWSGNLFFIEKEGSILDIESLVIEAIDLFPADLGNGSYTEYDNMDRINSKLYSHQEYMDDKDILEASVGHIHSHNTMGSFFSPTDDTEITSHAKNHDYYLSLIVNNNMQCVAKICEVVEIIDIKKVIGRNGIPIITEKKSDGVIKYDAIIEFEEPKRIEDEFFEKAMDALDEFIKTKIQPTNLYGNNFYYKDLTHPSDYSFNKKNTSISQQYIQRDLLDDLPDSNPFIKPNKLVGNSEDLALAVLSGWALDEKFNYEEPTLVDIEEFIDLIQKDGTILLLIETSLKPYINKYSDKILAICKDYNIPASNVDGIIKQIEYSLEAELAPWNADYYNQEQVGIINSIIIILKSLNK